MQEEIIMDLTEEQIKALFFEIYAAGFEAGYSHVVDIETAYNRFWNQLTETFNERK
jgi:hypothetical protein